MVLTAGSKLSHYEIIAQLGAGGMGVVYRARDHRLGRELALKVLPAESMDNENDRARLLREAQMASSLNHPHIAHIYEVGEDRDLLFNAIQLAVACAYMGDIDRAMGYMDRAYEERLADLLWLDVEPSFDPLRSDPRFQELVRRVDLAKRT